MELKGKISQIIGAVVDITFPEGENLPEPDTTTQKQEETLEEQLPAGYYQERELVKLLLMYGQELIVDQREDENGEMVYEQVSVAQLIIDDLKLDGFLFTDPVNRKIFNLFDQALDEGRIPDDQFFVSNEDDAISLLAADLLSSPYRLDDWARHQIYVKREEDTLRSTVLSTIFRYKDLMIDERRKAIEEELKTTTDPDDTLILLKRKKDLDELRKQINHQLGIVIAK